MKSHSYAFLRQGGRLCAQSIPEYDNLFWSQGLIEIQANKIAFLEAQYGHPKTSGKQVGRIKLHGAGFTEQTFLREPEYHHLHLTFMRYTLSQV